MVLGVAVEDRVGVATSLTVLGALILALAIVLPWVESFKLSVTGVEAQLREILLLEEQRAAIEENVETALEEAAPPDQREQLEAKVIGAIRSTDSDWSEARRALLASYLERYGFPAEPQERKRRIARQVVEKHQTG